MPIFSVIIPVYNVETYLRPCLDSILHQSSKNIEVILIDDGSTDQSANICDAYLKYENISCIHTDNHGVSFARNLGLSKAKGEWIFFLDSDDWIDPDLLSDLQSVLDSNNELDIIQFGLTKVSEDDKWERIPLGGGVYNGIDEYFNNSNFIPGIAGYVIRRSLITSSGLSFSEGIRYSEDHEFILKCFLLSQRFYVLSKSYYNYRDRDGSAVKKIKDYSIAYGCLTVFFNIQYFAYQNTLKHSPFLFHWLSYTQKEYFRLLTLLPFSYSKIREYYSDYLQVLHLPSTDLVLPKYTRFQFYKYYFLSFFRTLILNLYLSNKFFYRIAQIFKKQK